MTATAPVDGALAAFAAEMLDDTTDLGAFAGTAFDVDRGAAWDAVYEHAAAMVAGTTPRASRRTRVRRRAGAATLRTLSTNPHTPTATLISVVNTAADARLSSDTIVAAISHPNRDAALLRTIADRYGNRLLRTHGTLTDPALPHDLLRTIVGTPATNSDVAEICTRTDLDADLLDWLTGPHGDTATQHARTVPAHHIALRAGLPEIAYQHLAQHPAHIVRCAVARNISTDAATLALLAGDDDLLVRYHVADNPNTSRAVVEQLADDRHDDVAGTARSRLLNDDWPVT